MLQKVASTNYKTARKSKKFPKFKISKEFLLYLPNTYKLIEIVLGLFNPITCSIIFFGRGFGKKLLRGDRNYNYTTGEEQSGVLWIFEAH